ncbi:hypothetical protein JCM8208_006196 [Rhodotorula glutinis]
MSTDQDDFAAYTTIGDRTDQPQDLRAPLHARPTGPSFHPPPKLEPFLLLAKSARGAGAASLVSQAVGAPGVYVFAELLDQPSIRDLANHEQHAQQHRLLELFAFGTWADYEAKRDSYPALTPDQETKLRHLTVLTLASSQRSIPYALLLSRLSLPDVATLEDLLIAAFYAGVLRGKLDAREQRLEVLSAQGRDVRRDDAAVAVAVEEESMEVDPTSVSTAGAAQTPTSLLASLRIFQSTLAGLIASLSVHLGDLHARALNDDELRGAHEERVEGMVREVGRKEIDGGGGGGGKKGGGRKSVVQGFASGSTAAASASALAQDVGGDMDVDAASTPSGGGGGGASGGASFLSALAGAVGVGGTGTGSGSGGGGGSPAQGAGRGAAGSPTGGGAAARARKRNRQ